MSPQIFGIDLGTTFSCIAYLDEHGKPVTLKNGENEAITPSVVFFDDANVIVGSVAKAHALLKPHDVVEAVKRHMGDPNWLFEHHGRSYRAEEVSAAILRKVAQDAGRILGEEITDVVITCPAYFGINEREATANAGKIAGLNVRAVLNEPTAAALAYGARNGAGTGRDEVVLVFDLGGGTFDVTMIEIRGSAITALCTGGDHNLGGKDWDSAVVAYFAEQFSQQTGSSDNILGDLETLQELHTNAEKAKKTLSTREEAPVRVVAPSGTARVVLTREKFDELTAPLLERTIMLTEQMLGEAREKGYREFDKIILVGGSTRMPQAPRRLGDLFPNVPINLFDPDECVAHGAALYARTLAPDGAGHGSMPPPPTITDVTSKTFGIVVVHPGAPGDSIVANLICRNTPVPANIERSDFATTVDNQQSVEIRLMENSAVAPEAAVADSTEIAKAELQLPSGLRAGAQIIVRFELNKQGRLHLEAEGPDGRNVPLDVQTASVMSPREVEAARGQLTTAMNIS